MTDTKPPRRHDITINITTGEWVAGVETLQHPEGLIVACSVMPGLTPELLDDWYGQWMSHDDPANTGRLMWVPNIAGSPVSYVAEYVNAVEVLVEIARGFDGVGPMNRLSCSEAEAIAGVVRASGNTELADALIEQHSHGDDDPEDQHYRGTDTPE